MGQHKKKEGTCSSRKHGHFRFYRRAKKQMSDSIMSEEKEKFNQISTAFFAKTALPKSVKVHFDDGKNRVFDNAQSRLRW